MSGRLVAGRNRTAALVTSGAGLLAMAVVGLTAGEPGSVLLGLAMVLGFFGAGSLPFAVVGDGSRAGLAFLVLGMTYLLRVLLGAVAYVVAVQLPWVDMRVVGLTVIGCALVWTATHVVLGLSRRHQPTLEV